MAVGIWASPPEAPYVACLDGHIARTLAECPEPIRHKNNEQVPYGGGNGGLLGGIGGLLGGIL